MPMKSATRELLNVLSAPADRDIRINSATGKKVIYPSGRSQLNTDQNNVYSRPLSKTIELLGESNHIER